MQSKNIVKKQVVGKIINDFNNLSTILPEKEYVWIETHRDYPHIVDAITDLDGTYTIQVWQITKNIDEEESYHIAYNPLTRDYGIITILASGLNWYMGDYGTLFETCMAL